VTMDEPERAIDPLNLGGAVTVLLVDDQIMVGEAVRRALREETDTNFHFCSDPLTALAIAKKIAPTVILQDLVMPGVDGLQLVRDYRVDRATSNIPIIVLSTKDDPKVKRDSFKAGANDYLVKLPDQIELIARIRYHSMAYVSQRQRDEAYRALYESQRKLIDSNLALQRLTNVDGLTGLNNRRYFNEYTEAEWSWAIRTQTPISVLMIDVDHFKKYNDAYGHIAGDEVLKKVADAIRKTYKRSKDLAARFGGEEFVMVLPHTPLTDVHRIGNDLCAAVEAMKLLHRASDVSEFVTVSVGGVETIPQQGDAFMALLEAADQALYEAKRAGRNRAVIRAVDSLPANGIDVAT
jgi:two-component system chemotaxis family response regulator WspR